MPEYKPRKVHLATLYEFTAKKTGKVYLKGRMGDVDLLLFKNDTDQVAVDGRQTNVWNLIASENPAAREHRKYLALTMQGGRHAETLDAADDVGDEDPTE